MRAIAIALSSVLLAVVAAEEPRFVPYPTSYDREAPGALSVDALQVLPAGREGSITARDGHFFSGNSRVRFWGTNICFGGCFPSHEEADRVALRLARFGINCVRFHNFDSTPDRGSIFADAKCETLDPAQLEKLDYFIAALKKQGIYTNLNLHVGRAWSQTHDWPDKDKLPRYDKMIDLFHPELIAAQKEYARDLLTHVNPYTGNRYADEPAIAMVEVSNEDSLFMWNSRNKLASLPESVLRELRQQWNVWLLKKYGSRQAIKGAWEKGIEPTGDELLTKPLRPLTEGGGWVLQTQPNTKATFTENQIDITQVTGTAWHVQLHYPGLKLRKGQFYTVELKLECDPGSDIDVAVSQHHEPWKNLGLNRLIRPTVEAKNFRFGFVATDDEANARLTLQLGRLAGKVRLVQASLCPGGQDGLLDDEDPATNSVRCHGESRLVDSQQRSRDWYEFLVNVEESFYKSMRFFLKDEIGVKCPVGGSIVFSPLGLPAQSQMDFVDGHAYWDHPKFPRKPWDTKDWYIDNNSMTDFPQRSSMPMLSHRIDGKPFTVTEYNHPSPNEFESECIPMIATIAALQDWDGVFLFNYSSNHNFVRERIAGYFDTEGSPLKLGLSPLGAQIFLGNAVPPLPDRRVIKVDREHLLDTSSTDYHDVLAYLVDHHGLTPQDFSQAQVALSFERGPNTTRPDESRLGGSPHQWTASERATGRFTVASERACLFAGFSRGAMPISLGALTIESIDVPFAVIALVPAKPNVSISESKQLLLCAASRAQNTGMKWNDKRNMVTDWGSSPAMIEVVNARLRVGSDAFVITPLDPAGKPMSDHARPIKPGESFEIGDDAAMWYLIERR